MSRPLFRLRGPDPAAPGRGPGPAEHLCYAVERDRAIVRFESGSTGGEYVQLFALVYPPARLSLPSYFPILLTELMRFARLRPSAAIRAPASR